MSTPSANSPSSLDDVFPARDISILLVSQVLSVGDRVTIATAKHAHDMTIRRCTVACTTQGEGKAEDWETRITFAATYNDEPPPGFPARPVFSVVLGADDIKEVMARCILAAARDKQSTTADPATWAYALNTMLIERWGREITDQEAAHQ